MLKKLIIIFTILVTGAPVLANEEIVAEQPNAPISIEAYNSSYRSPERGIGDGSIVHRLSVRNISDRRIEAYGIGFRTFDAFNRSMGRPFVGYDMNPVVIGATSDPVWENRALAAYLFRRHGTAIAYVAIVRVEDGSVWKADEASIMRQLTDLELDLTVSEEFEQ